MSHFPHSEHDCQAQSPKSLYDACVQALIGPQHAALFVQWKVVRDAQLLPELFI